MGKTFDFFLGTPDPGVTARLKALGPGPEALDRRYTQEEDFFLVLDRPFEVDSFEIHHDVADPVPSKRYRDTVNSLVESWGTQIPGSSKACRGTSIPGTSFIRCSFRCWRRTEDGTSLCCVLT